MPNPENAAAWITAKHGRLEVGPAPYPSVAADQVVVRNHAVAVNPLEWIIQADGTLLYGWLNYPSVLGSDVAGEVVEVGAAVTRFRVGDRVLGHAVGTDKDSNNPAEGGFQLYTAVLERMASPIPDTMTFEHACVLPLGLSTASCALFQNDQLGLRLPTPDAEPTGQTVLVWGGSTSVGSNAVQLAVAAGYEVISTASPHNVDYVNSLGASLVVDHHRPDAVAGIVAAFAGRSLAGAIAIGTTGAQSCVRIVNRLEGRRFVSVATPPVSFASLADEGTTLLDRVRVTRRLITSNVALQVRARTHGTRIQYIFGTSLKNNEVSTAIYRDFLPAALAAGRYRAAPDPTVVGHGVDEIQHALDVQRAGVSASKVVVTLV